MKSAKIIIPVLLVISSLMVSSCETTESKSIDQSQAKRSYRPPQVKDEGRFIKVDMSQTDQLASYNAEKKVISTELKAPCKILISSIKMNGQSPSLIYESNELSETVSDYQKTKVLLEKSTRETRRLKELIAHQAAAGKELLEAQAELDQENATLSSLDSKLRVTGLNVSHSLQLSPGNVLVVADIPESQLGRIRVGSSVNIVFNSYPTEKFSSRISEIGSVVDPITRSVKIQAVLQNKSGKLLPGFYGQMLLGLSEMSAITIPVSSVFTARGKSYLFVENQPGEFERREVIIGVQGDDWVEVLQGVSSNEKIVTKGTMLLKSLSFGY
ncbi:MAG: efflux RND transporter periplasmic adaptor subunit [Bacteroidota bacterium]|nr:efflux RND transporter periplasmic adaptor subunit [Bacteroidota bacterium]